MPTSITVGDTRVALDDSVVDRYWREFSEVDDSLRRAGDLSIYTTMTDTFRKTLLLTAASYFETQMQKAVASFVSEATKENELITSLVNTKAIKRQYHTWFNWDARNVNQFLALFGKNFREYMEEKIKSGDPRREAVNAFLEIGASRNRLVHNNFGEFQMEKTMGEIYVLYQHGREFVGAFPKSFHEFSKMV